MRPITDALVAFDFDGTLAHDTSESWMSVERLLREHGVDIESPEIRRVLDDATSNRSLVEACVEEPRRDRVYRSIVRLLSNRVGQIRLLPGVAEMLDELRRRYKLAIYSGRDPESLRAALQTLGIVGLFDHVEADCGIYPPKPDPAALRAVASRAQIPVDRCVYVGDRMTDSASAAAAGYHFIAAVWRKDRFPPAVNRCARVSGLGLAIDRLLRGDHPLE